MRFRGPKALPDNIKERPFWSRVLSVELNPSRKDTFYDYSSAAMGWMSADGRRTLLPSVEKSAIPLTNENR